MQSRMNSFPTIPPPDADVRTLAPSRSGVNPLDCLSAREHETLQLVVMGQTTAQIAVLLCLSPKTVETYRSRLMAKLDIHHVPGLVKFAVKTGLLSRE